MTAGRRFTGAGGGGGGGGGGAMPHGHTTSSVASGSSVQRARPHGGAADTSRVRRCVAPAHLASRLGHDEGYDRLVT
jgi:hypothetical protein